MSKPLIDDELWNIMLQKVKTYIPDFHQHILKTKSGNLTTFYPDPTIFKINTKFSLKKIKNQLIERAYLVAGVYVHLLNDKTGKNSNFYFESGIKSLLSHHNKQCLRIGFSFSSEFSVNNFLNQKIFVKQIFQN